jgi:hypothetical protein
MDIAAFREVPRTGFQVCIYIYICICMYMYIHIWFPEMPPSLCKKQGQPPTKGFSGYSYTGLWSAMHFGKRIVRNQGHYPVNAAQNKLEVAEAKDLCYEVCGLP